MTGSKVIVTALAIGLVILFPSIASAQEVLPHVFSGTATVNGEFPVRDGVQVAAIIDGKKVALVYTSGGKYRDLSVMPPGGVSFVGKTTPSTWSIPHRTRMSRSSGWKVNLPN